LGPYFSDIALGALTDFHEREATPMADDAGPDWHAGFIAYPVRVLFTLFMSGVGGVIGCAAAFILDLSILWSAVTVGAFAACAAAREWAHTATPAVGLATESRGAASAVAEKAAAANFTLGDLVPSSIGDREAELFAEKIPAQLAEGANPEQGGESRSPMATIGENLSLSLP
jgi:hypothetical protein